MNSSPFFEYLGDLFEHGEPLIGAALILVAAFFPRVQKYLDQHPNRRLLWVSLISLCVFFAGFLTWKAEHDRYMSAVFRLDVPTFTIEGGTTYQILPDDYLLSVASIPDKKTILKLPPAPHKGQRFEIKDANGAVSPSVPIVVDGNGYKIDQGATWEMSTGYSAITVTFNGIRWVIT